MQRISFTLFQKQKCLEILGAEVECGVELSLMGHVIKHAWLHRKMWMIRFRPYGFVWAQFRLKPIDQNNMKKLIFVTCRQGSQNAQRDPQGFLRVHMSRVLLWANRLLGRFLCRPTGRRGWGEGALGKNPLVYDGYWRRDPPHEEPW